MENWKCRGSGSELRLRYLSLNYHLSRTRVVFLPCLTSKSHFGVARDSRPRGILPIGTLERVQISRNGRQSRIRPSPRVRYDRRPTLLSPTAATLATAITPTQPMVPSTSSPRPDRFPQSRPDVRVRRRGLRDHRWQPHPTQYAPWMRWDDVCLIRYINPVLALPFTT